MAVDMNPWPVARAALRQRPFTAVALVLLIALTVALGVAVGAVERAVHRGSVRAIAGFDLIVGAAGSPTQLVLASVFLRPEAIPLAPGDTLARLAADPGVAWLSPIGFGDNWRGHAIVGVAPPFVTWNGRRPLAEGRSFAEHEEAVIGADVPMALGAAFMPGHGRAADPDEPGHGHEHTSYTVVGRLPRQGNAWDGAILVPIESVWELHGLGDGHGGEEKLGAPWIDPPGVPAIVVAPRAVADAYRLRSAMRAEGRLGVFPAEVLVPLLRTLGDARGLVAALAWANAALVLAAAFLALSAVFAARRRSFAVLRALGAPRLFVAGAIWLEVGVILLGGVVVGLPLGWLAAYGMGQVAGDQVAFTILARPDWADLAAPALVLEAGLDVALVPAFSMGRRPIEDGLRS